MNEREARALAADLSSRAQGGRVAFSEFLEPDEADALMAELRAQGLWVEDEDEPEPVEKA
ncbi:MAG TPA: hypothetical protein PLU66_08920 [Trueperaceae bacterium]|nr:hypothetical protein [Trueperaceae bacterium]